MKSVSASLQRFHEALGSATGALWSTTTISGTACLRIVLIFCLGVWAGRVSAEEGAPIDAKSAQAAITILREQRNRAADAEAQCALGADGLMSKVEELKRQVSDLQKQLGEARSGPAPH